MANRGPSISADSYERLPRGEQVALVKEIVHRVGSPHIGIRLRAEKELESLGPSVVDALVQLTVEGEKRWRSRRGLYRKISIGFGVVAIPLVGVSILGILRAVASHQPNLIGVWATVISVVLGGGGGGILGGCSVLMIPSSDYLRASEALAKLEDKRSVGAIIDAMAYQYVQINGTRMGANAASQLVRLLPRFTAEDSDLLNQRQRETLYRLLRLKNAHRDDILQSCILKALDAIGDPGAAPYVQRMIEATASSLEQKDLQEEARTLYPRFRANFERATQGASLLRPASGPTEDAQNLLRPTGSPGKSEAALLLRASSSGSAEEESA